MCIPFLLFIVVPEKKMARFQAFQQVQSQKYRIQSEHGLTSCIFGRMVQHVFVRTCTTKMQSGIVDLRSQVIAACRDHGTGTDD